MKHKVVQSDKEEGAEWLEASASFLFPVLYISEPDPHRHVTLERPSLPPAYLSRPIEYTGTLITQYEVRLLLTFGSFSTLKQ